ncbi:MAG: TAXI family TRAP transporter solute-binding subunit [bacterium]
MKKFHCLGILVAMFSCVGLASAQTYSIGTNPQGSLFFSSGTAISKVMVEKTGQQYRVAPYGGSSTYIPLINKGQLAFGMANGGESAFAYNGTEIFAGKPNRNLRLVAVYLKNFGGYGVRANSSYQTSADLKGKRVSSDYVAGRIFHYLTGAILATADLTHDDFRKIPTPNFVAGINDFIQGRVDAAYIPLNSGIGKKAMASIKGGWRFVTFDGSAASQRKADSVLPSSRIQPLKPRKGLDGVAANPTNMLVVDFYVVTGTHVSDDVVYRLAKTMYGNKPALAKAFGVFNRFNPKGMAGKHPNPYHPGAIRFYKEVGIWRGGS